jgi:hypothetical protein
VRGGGARKPPPATSNPPWQPSRTSDRAAPVPTVKSTPTCAPMSEHEARIISGSYNSRSDGCGGDGIDSVEQQQRKQSSCSATANTGNTSACTPLSARTATYTSSGIRAPTALDWNGFHVRRAYVPTQIGGACAPSGNHSSLYRPPVHRSPTTSFVRLQFERGLTEEPIGLVGDLFGMLDGTFGGQSQVGVSE